MTSLGVDEGAGLDVGEGTSLDVHLVWGLVANGVISFHWRFSIRAATTVSKSPGKHTVQSVRHAIPEASGWLALAVIALLHVHHQFRKVSSLCQGAVTRVHAPRLHTAPLKHNHAPQAAAERRRLEALDAAISRLCSVLRQLLLSVAANPPPASPRNPLVPAGGKQAPLSALPLPGSPDRWGGAAELEGAGKGAEGGGREVGQRSVALLEELIGVVSGRGGRGS